MEDISNTYSETSPVVDSDPDDLIVNLDGFEGPLDVLLTLAKSQKVDLMKISILQLTEQYLEFIAKVRDRNLELAADYLVMAAWMAFLKSNLLIPREETGEELSAEEMAERLKFQLKKLEAIRQVSQKLMSLPKLGIDFFNRGMPEGIRLIRTPEYYLDLYDLLKSYSTIYMQKDFQKINIPKLPVFTTEDGINRIKRFLNNLNDWKNINALYPENFMKSKDQKKTGIAGLFAGSLELVKEGNLKIKQKDLFENIYIKETNE